MKVTVGIAAYKEPLIDKCLRAVLREKPFEVIVACPDELTARIVKRFPSVKLIKEQRKEGKPAAVNKILAKARGNIIVLTDADMVVKKGSFKHLVEPFKDKGVSVVCGHPVIVNRKGMMAYWGRLLYDIVHQQRLAGAEHLTTNLCAFRKGCIKSIPEESLVDDYVIGLECSKKGGFVYAPMAKVRVKFPTNISDFLKQRVRTFAGYMQVRDWYGSVERSLGQEAKQVRGLFSYVNKPRHLFFLGLLGFFRLIAWLGAFYKYRIKNEGLNKIWQPAKSTKQ